MKTKIYKILGVALTLVLLASLTVGLASVPASGATTSNLKFTKLSLPKVEEWAAAGTEAAFANSEGDFWATPEIDCGPIAMDPEGNVLFAAAYPDAGGWYEVLKSIDGGYTWIVTGFYDMWTDIDGGGTDDGTWVVDMVTSSEYGDDTTVAVATQRFVYISDDGGKNFVLLNNPWTGNITDLDVTIADDGDLAIIVGTDTGEVWVKKGLLGWQDQLFPGTNTLAAGFLPTWAADGNIGTYAIDTDGATYTVMSFTFNDINTGGGWGTSGISNAPFTDAEGIAFGSVFARAAFPEDFDAFGVGSNVCFVGITTAWGATTLLPNDGDDAYKVILKEAGNSTAVDLDVRGVVTTLLPTATAVTSIDVCGNADAATILVGTDCCNLLDTPTYFFAYHSEDSGDNWQFSFKQPTGGTETAANVTYASAWTQVLMAPDFCGGSTAYCSTLDGVGGTGIGTSAFQCTTDGAASWNQISLIDDFWTGADDYTICGYGFSATGYLANDTLRRKLMSEE